nr:MAG TPA: hypothetical protein [Caudoviricetes sp.]
MCYRLHGYQFLLFNKLENVIHEGEDFISII